MCELRCDQGTKFVGARHELAELMKEMDQQRVKDLQCEFLMNPPVAGQIGCLGESNKNYKEFLMTFLSAQRPQSLSFMYDVMAIINSRLLITEYFTDPSGPEPLTQNPILIMKSKIILPLPRQFGREVSEKLSIWFIHFGLVGGKYVFLI